MTLTNHPTSSPTRVERPKIRANEVVNSYSALLKSVRAAGLLRRRRGYYVVLLCILGLAGAVLWTSFFLIGDAWTQLLVAAALGILYTQFAFVGHEAAHQQVFASRVANEWTARLIATSLVGMSYAYWTDKHGRHHVRPNGVNEDPDIAPGAVIFHNEVPANRGFIGRAFGTRQGYFLFPLLLFLGYTLYADSVKYLFRAASVAHRWLEVALLGMRFGVYLSVVFLFLSPGVAVAFVAVQTAVFGLYMGGCFAPNHKGMPVLPERSRVDFFTRQVLTSRNIGGGRFMTVFMGGLNHQVEHHLFPDMPRPHLRKVRRLVKTHCATAGVPYTETGLIRSYVIVIRYLNRVGMKAADPFTCPITDRYRPS
ncbi:acyl-CoA desaturase [uncultured Arthrobacter sp.]|uniref:fatty acid desaturase family protein n=1 Tax=uncultured Arthrobacter sp. TaxID=114050 RepID=UPI00263285CD|nr:acyl-CoA desaturase [uncultured Arthrobacter sp.]